METIHDGYETGVPGKYDAAFKTNLSALAAALATFFRPGIEALSIELLNVERKKWIERQEDALFRIKFSDGKVWLLHLEIQATNARDMLGRMMVYGGLDYMMYETKTVQVVLYIGGDTMQMEDGAESETGRFDYRLIDIRTLSPDLFLRSNSPELWTYAFLTAPDRPTRLALIDEIITALRAGPFSAETRAAAIASLVALAPLRKEEETIKQKIKGLTMELKIDLRNVPFFEEIFEKGEEKGEAKGIVKGIVKGIEKGIEKGMDKGRIQAVLNMRRKTGASAEIIADTLDFDLEWVKKILAEQKI